MKEFTGNVQKKSQSLPTTLKKENEVISDKNVISEEFNTLFIDICPKLANETSQVSKMFNQYFSPVDTQIDHHNLTFKKMKLLILLINHLYAPKLMVLMM